VSSSFGFSSTSSRITAKATSELNVSSYTIYLEKRVLFVWTVAETVTYYVDGTNYYYDFTDLSTSATYRLRFYSPDGKIIGSGSISNYAG
jgi:hypothetical protein